MLKCHLNHPDRKYDCPQTWIAFYNKISKSIISIRWETMSTLCQFVNLWCENIYFFNLSVQNYVNSSAQSSAISPWTTLAPKVKLGFRLEIRFENTKVRAWMWGFENTAFPVPLITACLQRRQQTCRLMAPHLDHIQPESVIITHHEHFFLF